METESRYLSVLSFLQHKIAGTLREGDRTHMHYPTAISCLLNMQLVAVEEGGATVEIKADAAIHGNQQGTVHGGLIAELADATMGTAHSTLLAEGESFASIDLSVRFLRPVWQSRLRAVATATHRGKTVSHYRCDIYLDDGKLAATASSAMMTLRGERARGR